MGKISCNIIKDLMPLYVDGVLSEETAQTVREHMMCCDDCQEEYRLLKKELVLPSNRDIQAENSKALRNFKHRLRRKELVIACISVIVTFLVMISCYLVYQEVAAVHDYFSPDMTVILRDIQSPDTWERLCFDDSGYLTFDSIFYSKEVVSNANNSDVAELRISSRDGETVMENIIIYPGEKVSLDVLEKNTAYIVEVRTTAAFLYLSFY